MVERKKVTCISPLECARSNVVSPTQGLEQAYETWALQHSVTVMGTHSFRREKMQRVLADGRNNLS